MILEIKIPVEFEDDFNNDRFSDFFNRMIGDMNYYDMLCGLYEEEIAWMLLKAFKDAKIK